MAADCRKSRFRKVCVRVLGNPLPNLAEKARDVLSSPSRRTIRLKRRPQGVPYAGISALSRCSDLSDDAEPTFAMTSAAAKGIPESAKCRLGGVKVELWRYDPGILSADGECVDPLSLCLSLADEAKSDPRVLSRPFLVDV